MRSEHFAVWFSVAICCTIPSLWIRKRYTRITQLNQYYRVLDFLIQERNSACTDILSIFGIHPSVVVIPWLRTLYAAQLPVTTLFKLWDILFLRGEIVLFRLAISVFGRIDMRNKDASTILADLNKLDSVALDVHQMTDASVLDKDRFDALIRSIDY